MTSDAHNDLLNEGPRSSGEVDVVLSGEQLRTETEWVESGRIRLRRRIVAHTRTIEVVVRREELIIETQDVAPGAEGTMGETYRGIAMDGPAVPGPTGDATPPLVLVLREEVPDIVLRPQVYERVTVDVVTVSEVAIWHDDLRHEEADVITTE